MNFKDWKNEKGKQYSKKDYGILKELKESEQKVSDLNLEFDDEKENEVKSKLIVENLFDGYIGEKNFVPNPYEYGPNATYRNLNEGIVYKKNEQNLWEAFVRDGKPGQQGPRGFAGGGTGVEEVKKIATQIATSAVAGVVVSGSGSVTSVGLSSNTLNVIGSPINTNGTFSVNLSSVTSAGTFTKFICDQYGRVISGGSLQISDFPALSSIPTNASFATSSTSGFLTSADWNTFNSKSEISYIDVLDVCNEVYGLNISAIGLEDKGDYVQSIKPMTDEFNRPLATIRNGNKIVVAGNSICFYATNFYGTNRSTRSETNSATVSVGTIRFPSYMKVSGFEPVKLVCTISGVTSSSEPDWPSVNNTVADGTAVWTVSSDTDTYGTIAGYFNIANTILGQAFDPLMYVGAKSRKWQYIKEILDREFSKGIDPDIVWLLAPFENDVAGASSYSEKDLIWESFKEFLDRMVLARRKIVLQGIHPASTYTSAGYGIASYLDMMMEKYAEEQSNQVFYWSSPKESYLSMTPSASWVPDTTVKYAFSTGGAGTESDGIHPYGIRNILLGIDAADKIGNFLKLNKKSFRDYSVSGTQRYFDSRNLTSGGTIGAGISGSAPGDWSIQRTGSGIASASIITRSGISHNEILLNCSGSSDETISCTWKATKTLSSLGLNVGDNIKVIVEITPKYLSTSANFPFVELTLVGSFGSYPSSPKEMQFTGLGNQMHGQAMLDKNIPMIFNPVPWKILTIPPSCTGLSLSIKQTGKGNWNGDIVIGRVNIEKVS